MTIARYIKAAVIAILIAAGMAAFNAFSIFVFSSYRRELVRLIAGTFYTSLLAVLLWKKCSLAFGAVKGIIIGRSILCGFLLFCTVWTARHLITKFNHADVVNLLLLNDLFLLKFLVASFVAPVCEEIIFRGFLLGQVLKTNNRSTDIFSISIIFACFHISFPLDLRVWINFLGFLVVGAILGSVYLRSGSLMPPIIMHSVINLSAFLLTTSLFPFMTPTLSLIAIVVMVPALWLALRRLDISVS